MQMLELQDRAAISELDLVRSLCRDSLYFFVQEMWDIIIPEDPVWNWHIKYLCDELQAVAERVFRMEPKEYDLIINVPPGTTKSTITSICFPLWTWIRKASCRHICGSYSQDLAWELSRKSRDILRHEKFQRLFPELKIQPDQDAKGHWANTRLGSRFSVGTGGNAIGRHAHFLIVDDPINPNAALSIPELQAANVWMDEHLSQRKVNKAVSVTILIMQRLHQNDPTGNMLEKGNKLRHICLPAELGEQIYVNPPECRAFYKDGLLDPLRIGRTVLEEAKKTLGPYGYAGQFDQNPIPRGGAMFKVDAIRRGRPPADSEFKRIVRYWDKAGTEGGGAYTVGVKMGETRDGKFWVLNLIRGQWRAEERERIIKQTARLDGRAVTVYLEQEPGSAGKESYENSAKRLIGFRVKPDKVTGSKELRADEMSTAVNNGMFYIPSDASWEHEYIEEMRYFPQSRFMDQIDASSGAFNALVRSKRVVGSINTLFKQGA